MKTYMLKLAALASLMLVFVTSCKKDSVDGNENQLSAAQSTSDAEGMIESVDAEATYRMSPSTAITGCPTITWSATQGTFPNTCTIDFGTGCVGQYGHEFSGKIIVDVTAPYFEQGSVRTTHTEHLTVNGNSLELTRTVTNQGLDANNHLYWTVEASGTHVRTDENTAATWSASRIRTMTAGLDTEDSLQDDTYEITGGATGVCHRGREFTSTITTPLVKRGDCRWISSGVEVVTVEGRRGDRVLDFGDGSCDDKATVTLPNGATREITLHRPRR